MKGLILCAGEGRRLQPLSYSQPKTLVPVANKPVLIYCIEHLHEIEITEIAIVLNPVQEKAIRAKLKNHHLDEERFTYIYQEEPNGIADALKQAEAFIGKDCFLLLLGDNLIQESLAGLKETLEQEDIQGSIMLAKVDNPSDYGIAEIREGRIIGLEEKPNQPKSNLAIIGAYAFTSAIFKAVHSIKPSARGELEITDAIQWLIAQGGPISYSITEQKYSDVGNVERWLEANRWMLNMKTDEKSLCLDQVQIENCRIISPVLIDRGAVIKNSIIGPYTSIGAKVSIEGCQIENSIVLEDARLANITEKIRNSIIGRQAEVVGEYQEQESIEVVLGDKSTIVHHSSASAKKGST